MIVLWQAILSKPFTSLCKYLGINLWSYGSLVESLDHSARFARLRSETALHLTGLGL